MPNLTNLRHVSIKQYAATFAIFLLLVWYGTQIINSIDNDGHWDIGTYYFTAKAYFDGGINPYNRAAIHEYFEWQYSLPVWDYLYPPVTLIFFWTISLVGEFITTAHIWLFAKFVLLIPLIVYWRREYLSRTNIFILIAFCLFVFNGTIYIDLRTGNISVFEQIVLWSAFFFYLRRRWLAFALLISLVALFKITLILFLGLLLLNDDPRKYRHLVGSASTFGLSLGPISLLMVGENYVDYARKVHGTVESYNGDITTPSTLAVLTDIRQMIFVPDAGSMPKIMQFGVHAILVSGIVWVFWRVCQEVKQREYSNKTIFIILFSCLTYAIIVPRFKDYSNILLIVPLLYMTLLKKGFNERQFSVEVGDN